MVDVCETGMYFFFCNRFFLFVNLNEILKYRHFAINTRSYRFVTFIVCVLWKPELKQNNIRYSILLRGNFLYLWAKLAHILKKS